jgi:hypothetical protein
MRGLRIYDGNARGYKSLQKLLRGSVQGGRVELKRLKWNMLRDFIPTKCNAEVHLGFNPMPR